jgi:acyl-coenzyme A thioesterase PaaI-like protein
MPEESLQDRYAPNSVCFGCGPANEEGLRIKSRVDGEEVVCDWIPKPWHHAFDGILNGGITGAILDCHSNWTAVNAMMVRDATEVPPPTVTAEFAVKMLKPIPMDAILHLRAKVVGIEGAGAVVEATLESEEVLRATFLGTFVAVKQGHPAYSRWR